MSVFVSIDSRCRDPGTSSISDYTVTLMEDIKDVCAVKIRSTDIPPMWNVPVGRTSLWVSAPPSSPPAEIRMAPGNYASAAAAAAALQAALNGQAPALAWTASAGAAGRIGVSASGPFVLFGGDGVSRDAYGPASVGRILGFSAGPAASGPTNAVEAPHVNQLDVAEVMYVHVEDFDAIRGTGYGGGERALDVVKPNGSGVLYDRPAIKEFSPPLTRLSRLRVRILDYYGRPIDFDNREHRIDLEFVTLRR